MSLIKNIVSKGALAATVITAGAIVSTGAQATEGYFQNGIGARHKALAGAGVADSRDATAITLNPAGLVHAGRQFNGSLSLFMPFREYTASPASAGLTGGIIAPGNVKSKRNIFPVPNIAYSHPLDEDSVIGFSLSGNGGMNTTYRNVPNTTPNCMGGTGVFCGGKSGVDLTQVIISSAYARKFGENISMGIGPVLILQRFKAKGLGFFGAAGFSADPANLTNRGYDYILGFGVRGGIEVKLTDNFRIGGTFQTKVVGDKFKKYRGLFAQAGSFDVPANFQVGLAFDITPDITFMFDYRHIFYSGVQAISNPNPTGALLGQGGGPGFGWKDTDTFKFGIEYDASEALTLRAGYSYNNNPIPNTQVTFNVLAPGVVKHHITGGASLKISPNSQLDFAAVFVPSAKQTGFTGAVMPQVTTIKMHQFEVTAGYTYHWN